MTLDQWLLIAILGVLVLQNVGRLCRWLDTRIGQIGTAVKQYRLRSKNLGESNG